MAWDESHVNLPSPDAPSFIAMDKNTGEVYWTDKSPIDNILHGQWSSPAVGLLGGVPQAIFAGGDGWVYSFKADKGTDGAPELLWKFDANPKVGKWILGGRGTRNNIIATPVIYDGYVYVAVGQDPEHGEGHLWCIDPTKRGNVGPELAINVATGEEIAHQRLQAVIEEDGQVARDNPNSAVVWHYSVNDVDGDGEYNFEETMPKLWNGLHLKMTCFTFLTSAVYSIAWMRNQEKFTLPMTCSPLPGDPLKSLMVMFISVTKMAILQSSN